MSDLPSVERFGRRRPFHFARRTPRPGRYASDGLDLDAAEEAIAAAPVEIGYGFDASGRQIFRQVGTEHALSGFRTDDLGRIRDGIFLHNHPPYDYPEGDPRRRAGSFSALDLVFMYEQELSEMVLVTAERRYRLRRPPEGFYLDPGQIRREYRAPTAIVRRRLRRQAARGELTIEAAASRGRLVDEVMDRLGPFFVYTIEERR